MNWEMWWVLKRDTGEHIGSHVTRRLAGDTELQAYVDAWSGPVVLFNTTTREVFY